MGGGDPDVWEDEFGEDCFEDEGDDERWWWERWVLSPRRRDVRVIVGSWWRKVGVLMVLPAVVVSIYMRLFPEDPGVVELTMSWGDRALYGAQYHSQHTLWISQIRPHQ